MFEERFHRGLESGTFVPGKGRDGFKRIRRDRLLTPAALLAGVTLMSLGGGAALCAASALDCFGADFGALQAALYAERLAPLFFALSMAGALTFFVLDQLAGPEGWEGKRCRLLMARADAVLWGCFTGILIVLFGL